MHNCKAIFVSCFLALIIFQAKAQLTQDEVNALNDMKAVWDDLDISPFGPWGDPELDDPCSGSWDGLACYNGHISRISPMSVLSGTIPESLGNLTELTILRLPQKMISGTIPSSISQLVKLQILDLSNNRMEGTIPDLSGAVDLTDLILFNNAFNGSVPDYELPLVENMNLASNNFSGELPQIDILFPELLIANFSNNNLSGSIPFAMGALRFITDFSVSGNKIVGTVPTLPSTMELFEADHNALTEISSQAFLHGGSLVTFDVSHNVISGNITELFDHLGELTELDVSFNHFDSYLPLLNGTTKIRHLFVGNNSLIGTIHQSYTSLATLKVLDASNNHLTGELPPFSGNMLSDLRLSSNLLTGPLPTSFTSLGVLNVLYLDRNSLSGAIPSNLTGDTLDFIHLEYNSFSGPLPVWNTPITELYLTGNNFSLCENPTPVTVTFCDVSMQIRPSCGCNLTEFFGTCTIDAQTSQCASPAPTSSPTQVPAPQAPTPNGGCQVASKLGFECRDGVWYADGGYIGTGNMTFEDPVVIGTDTSSIANFSSGVYIFMDTLTVRGHLHVSEDAKIIFTDITFITIQTRKELILSNDSKLDKYRREISAKRSYRLVPRITADCITINGNFSILLSSDDLDHVDGVDVALFRTNCTDIQVNQVRIEVPAGECRSINSAPTRSSGPPYTMSARFVVSRFNCEMMGPVLPPKGKSTWWVGLLVAIGGIMFLALMVVIIILCVRPAKEPLSPESSAYANEDATSTQMSVVGIDVSELASEDE